MPTTLIVPRDAVALSRFLREHKLPGARSGAAIRRLRKDREHRNITVPPPVNARQRLHRKLLTEVRAEVTRRGGETEIERRSGSGTPLQITDRDAEQRLVLATAHGWREYSRSFGARRASLAYLYGVDDSGPWATRVPGTMTTVAEALEWLEPAEVAKARAAGRRVRRQGDVYAVETTQAHDGAGADMLPAAHVWNQRTRHLMHRPDDGRKHRPLRLAYPVRFIQQRAYEMGRSGARACGD